MGKIALITGATSGIGEAATIAMAEAGYDLIITGRRLAQLTKIAKNIEKEHDVKVLPLSFDVRDMQQVEHYLGALPLKWSDIALLINNAGLAVGLNPINQGVLDDWERMIDTNIKGVLYITKIVSNLMIKRGGGHI